MDAVVYNENHNGKKERVQPPDTVMVHRLSLCSFSKITRMRIIDFEVLFIQNSMPFSVFQNWLEYSNNSPLNGVNHIVVQIGDTTSKSKTINRGIRQECPMFCILFNIHMPCGA